MEAATLSFELGRTDQVTFSGEAYAGLLGSADENLPVKLYYVRFMPAARTYWHIHSGPQILVMTSGKGRYQREGEPIQELAEGESVRFEGGVRHWHGAAADEPAEHIAINLDPGETVWQEEAEA